MPFLSKIVIVTGPAQGILRGALDIALFVLNSARSKKGGCKLTKHTAYGAEILFVFETILRFLKRNAASFGGFLHVLQGN